MDRKRFCAGIGACVGMFILILDGKTALTGMQSGVELCLQVVVPSLFPFFVLSILLTNALVGTRIGFLRPLCRLFAMPEGTESLLVAAFLGGYPVGAQSVAAACRNGQLTLKDGERMLAFCNNAGPAFLFGMIASAFPQPGAAWLLWGIHVVSAILTAQLIPAEASHSAAIRETGSVSLTGALLQAVRVMAAVCGWVLIFRMIGVFLRRWILWIFPAELQILLIGLLELSNGCCELICVDSVPLRFVLCSCLLACGGLCVTMQTVSVTQGMSLKYYFRGKRMQTMFSLGLSICISAGKRLYSVCVLILMIPFLIRLQKNSSIQEPVGV